ncbi:hypothetical protein Tco_0761247, partial [Tanacetum coccineum]
LTPFYKAFQVTADAPEIYMQEFWASAYVHNRSVRFKMNNKKHIIGLDQFRDILQICPKVGNKKFEEPPLEKEILAFLASLGHSGEIRKIIDIENKNTKKSNAMYYPRFTKLVVNFVMDKDPSIPRRNKVNWLYARDDPMFTTINVISRNEVTQLYGAILPVALTNKDIRNFESYKEYYAIASGTIPPKTKGSKKKADTDTITKQKPPTVPKEVKEKKYGKGKQKQLKIITKRSRQETHSSHASGSGADEGTGVTPGVPDASDYDSEHDISWKSSDDDQADEQAEDDEDAGKNDVNETTQDDEDDDDHDDDEKVQDDDDIIHEEDTDEDDSRISSSDDEDSDNEVEGANVEGAKTDEDATYGEDQGNEAVEDTNTDLDGRDVVMPNVILPQVQATQDVEDTHVTLTPVNPDGQQQSSSVS